MATYENDDEYEYYEEEYEEYDENAEEDDEWFYDEEDEVMKSPPQNVMAMLNRTYSQVLLPNIDDEDDSKDSKPFTLAIPNDTEPASRVRSRSRQIGGQQTQKKQSPNMLAINVIKGLFKHENLNQLPDPLNPEELEDLAPILENIISGSSTIPSVIQNLFKTTLDNMFGILNLDFNLLNDDYIYIKSVFVDHGDSNNSSIKFERIMKLLNHAKVSTIQISNVHLTQDSFDCIINYIANDDNYDKENYLQNAVNQMILHRKSGLNYDEIQKIYADQFAACGWEMSYDAKQQHVIITLNITASWEYVYDEDYDEDEPDDTKMNGSIHNITNSNDVVTTPPLQKIDSDLFGIPPPPDVPPPPDAAPKLKGPSFLNLPNIPPPPSSSDDVPPPPSLPLNAADTNHSQQESEYEYYYENEDGTTSAATGTTPRKDGIANNQNAVPLPDVPPPPSMNKMLSIHKKTDTLIDMMGGLSGLGGLPPPGSDTDDEEEDEDGVISGQNKAKFLIEVLTKHEYEGKVLFNGMLLEIIHCMQRMDVRKGQCIMKETEYGQNYDLKFFVVEYGVFDLYQQGRKLGIELFGSSTFGETHLVYGIPQYVTIRAATNKCRVWYLNRSAYYQISWKNFHKPFKNRLETKLNEFNVITTLGIGSFGRVLLVRDPTSKKTFSLKKLSKNNVIEHRQQQHIMNERSVLSLISTPMRRIKDKENNNKRNKSDHNTFCCKLYGLYQDKYYLYFLMEPLLGGELFTLLRHNKFFSEKVARFYLSCIIVAFEHLHSRNIIYRDIKPENIMLCNNGYCKLVDFGLAKLRNNSVTCCGTPEYLAPEVIQNYWQGFEVDYWGLGILLFEMIAGYPPFESYEQILASNVPIPKQHNPNKPYSKELLTLLNQLLIKHPYQRLGTTANKRQGIQEIYQHPWFQGFMSWPALKAQKFRPPYIPDIEDDEDVSNFEQVDEDDEYDKMRQETLFDDPELYKWCEYF